MAARPGPGGSGPGRRVVRRVPARADRQRGRGGRGEPAGYDKTVATTWSLAFTSLEQQSPAAITLLRLLACCAPEPVPCKVLLQPAGLPEIEPGIAGNLLPLTSDLLAAAGAVAALRGYSLVSLAGPQR